MESKHSKGVQVRSIRPEFLRVGETLFVTKEEADILVLAGSAEIVSAPSSTEKEGYEHRQMMVKGRTRK